MDITNVASLINDVDDYEINKKYKNILKCKGEYVNAERNG